MIAKVVFKEMAGIHKFLLFTRVATRNITMSAQRSAQEVLEDLKEKNPYYGKYAEKIAQLQKTSPQEFLKRVNKMDESQKKPISLPRTYSELMNPKETLLNGPTGPEAPVKRLHDIMKLELIANKTADEIKYLWYEYHKTKDVLVASLSIKQYNKLLTNAKQYPVFVLPLPRNEGFEFFVLQFAANSVHFTPLLAYQVHGENAPECLTVVHYTETQDKDIILMRGEYDVNVLSGKEAQCLANQLQMFYATPNDAKLQLLKIFNERPNEFNHMSVIKELGNIELLSRSAEANDDKN